MRAVIIAIVLCLLLQACGSKGALYLPADEDGGKQSTGNKQK